MDDYSPGIEATLERLVAERGNALRRYCYGILLHHHDAEDAVQTALVKTYRLLGTVRDPDALNAFVYRAAYTACMDILRGRKRASFQPGPPGQAGMRLSDTLESALHTLSPQDRALVIGRAVEERPYEQLARIHHRPAATLRKRYERARKRLAARLCSDTEINPQTLQRRPSHES